MSFCHPFSFVTDLFQKKQIPYSIHLTSGDEKVLVVSDVNPVLEELETAGVKTIVRDVPGDNIFL